MPLRLPTFSASSMTPLAEHCRYFLKIQRTRLVYVMRVDGGCREVAVAGAVKSAVGDRSDEGANLADDPADEIDPDVLKQVN